MHTVRMSVALFCLGLSVPAMAQQASGSANATKKWSVEVQAGFATAAEPTGGSAGEAFAAGTTFLTQAGTPTRAVQSWMFGDGATLFNDVAARFGQLEGRTFSRITPLDAGLRAAASTRTSGGQIGLRIGYGLSPRLRAELLVERGGGLDFNDAIRTAMTASAASFKTAFTELITTAPATAITVTGAVREEDPANSRLRVMGALTATIAERGALGFHLTAGGGVGMRRGKALSATVTGDYQFNLYGTQFLQEIDKTTITVSDPSSAPVFMGGASITWTGKSGSGLRADVRLLMESNRTVTTVSGAPFRPSTASSAVLPSVTTPAIQLSIDPAVKGSLSGESRTLTTFTGSGFAPRVQITLGYVVRF